MCNDYCITELQSGIKREEGRGKRQEEEHSLEGRMIDSGHEIYFGRDSTNFAPAKFSGRVSAAEVVAARRCWREFN